MSKILADKRLWLLVVCVMGTALVLQLSPLTAAQQQTPQPTPTASTFEEQTAEMASQNNTALFHFNGFWETLANIAPVMLLAAFLGGLVAYRRRLTVFEHNLFHAHILLSVAGALMMLIVGNQLVRAFGLLGAASVVRYRYGLRNPRDASMLIIALGIGMATGVGLYALAVSAAAVVFVFSRGFDLLTARTVLLMVVTHPMTLRVRTTRPQETMARIDQVFTSRSIKFRLRRLRRSRRRKGRQRYTLVYTVQIGPEDSRTDLTAEITDDAVLSVRWQVERPRKQ